MSELAINLLSGLLGALIGAFATLRAAQWQLRQIAQNHAEALEHQNRILEKTYANQLALQASELRLTAQVQFLQRLFEFFVNDAWPVYLIGHQLRNDWTGQIAHIGVKAYSNELASFRDKASHAVRAFAQVLDINRHHTSITHTFHSTLAFQKAFFEPIQLFIEALGKLPDTANRETITLINPDGQKFSQAVDAFGDWIESCKSMCVNTQSKLLAGPDIESAT